MRFKDFYINEAIAVDDVNSTVGKTKVSVFQGRLNPPTKAHTQIIPLQMKKSGYPVILFLVKGKGSDIKKNPLKLQDQLKMIKKSAGRNIHKIFVIDNGFIGEMVNILRDNNMEPVELWTGTDRLQTYKLQANKYKEKWNLDLDVKEIKRGEEDISASKVRQSAIDNDFETFKELTSNLDKSDFEILKKSMKV
jgi:hypothetical protein